MIVEETWKNLETSLSLHGIPEGPRQMLRRTFYAGFICAFQVINISATTPTEEARAVLAEVAGELNSFMVNEVFTGQDGETV